MNKIKLITTACALLLLTATILVACGSRPGKTEKTEAQQRPTITVTIEPLRFFTETIAGDRFEVKSMVPGGSSPETYDPTPQQLVELAGSRAYFKIGYIGFEQTWMDKLTDNAPHLQVFDMSEGIDLIFEEPHAANHPHAEAEPHTEAESHAHTADHHHHHHGGVEPHIWTSFANARTIAGNIMKALTAIDPDGKELYVERYHRFVKMVNQVDTTASRLLSQPATDRAFMIYHPALSYFARDYNLHQISIEAGGKEPSPGQLQAMIAICQAEGVKKIFVQPEFDKRNAQLIARQTRTELHDINPLSYHWLREMWHIVTLLANAETPVEQLMPDSLAASLTR